MEIKILDPNKITRSTTGVAYCFIDALNTQRLVYVNEAGAQVIIGDGAGGAGTLQQTLDLGSNAVGVGGMTVNTVGGGIQFVDTDAGLASAEITVLGSTGSILSFNDTDAGGGLQSIQMLGLTFGGFIITDDSENKGMVYAADYSANYTARSLCDKAYVDTAVINTYSEAYVVVATDSGGTWVTRTDGGFANKVIEVLICNNSAANATLGVRDFGSALARQCILDADSSTTMMVQADGTGQFEIFSDAAGIEFRIVGNFN